MNFLAHLKLSGDHEKIMLGNFIADHIRGNKIHHLPQEIIDGIMLHRKIDYYTDHHPAFIQTRTRLHKKYHKYAGVVADIFYDHFLARNWDDYAEISLSHFTSYTYGILLRNYTILPKKTKQLLPFIIMQNWLANYGKFDGLSRAFDMMARRAKNKSNMEFAVNDLQADYELYKEDFERFFPDIAAFCEKELSILFPGEEWENKNRIIKTAKLELIIKEREIEKKKLDEAQRKKKIKKRARNIKDKEKNKQKELKAANKKTAQKSDVKKAPIKKEIKEKDSKSPKVKAPKKAKKKKENTFSPMKNINEYTDKSVEALKEVSNEYLKRLRTPKNKNKA